MTTFREAESQIRGLVQWRRFDCEVSEPDGCRGTVGLCSRCNYYYAVCGCGAYHAICKCGVFAESDEVEAAVARESDAQQTTQGGQGES